MMMNIPKWTSYLHMESIKRRWTLPRSCKHICHYKRNHARVFKILNCADLARVDMVTVWVTMGNHEACDCPRAWRMLTFDFTRKHSHSVQCNQVANLRESFVVAKSIDELRLLNMEDYIVITIDGQKKFEFECEDNGDYLLKSLESIVGEPCRLSYINVVTSNHRPVRVVDGVFIPPKGGWLSPDERIYWVSKQTLAPTEPEKAASTATPKGIKKSLEIRLGIENKLRNRL